MRAVKGSLGHFLKERYMESEDPRWTRAVGSIPPTPYEDDDDLYPCLQPWTGRCPKSAGRTLISLKEGVLCKSA